MIKAGSYLTNQLDVYCLFQPTNTKSPNLPNYSLYIARPSTQNDVILAEWTKIKSEITGLFVIHWRSLLNTWPAHTLVWFWVYLTHGPGMLWNVPRYHIYVSLKEVNASDWEMKLVLIFVLYGVSQVLAQTPGMYWTQGLCIAMTDFIYKSVDKVVNIADKKSVSYNHYTLTILVIWICFMTPIQTYAIIHKSYQCKDI